MLHWPNVLIRNLFFYGSSPAGTIYKCKFIGLSSISIKLILATPRKNKRLARLVTHKFLNDNKDRTNYLPLVVTDLMFVILSVFVFIIMFYR